MYEEAWWERGACRTADPRIFDGRPRRSGRARRDGRTNRDQRDWSEAKALCGSCTVQPDCLEYVLDLPQDYNAGSDYAFAAGYEPRELELIRRKRDRR